MPPIQREQGAAFRTTAQLCWRFLLIVAAIYVVARLVVWMHIVVVPVAIALLLSGLLAPAVGWLVRHRVPRWPATFGVLVGGIAALGGVLFFVVNAFVAGLPDLQAQLTQSYGSIARVLAGPPFNISVGRLSDLSGRVAQAIASGGALTTAVTIGEIGAGLALALFSLIYFLHDGPQIWRFLLGAVPERHRSRVDTAGARAFAALVGYTRATIAVAFGDAVGIGLGLVVVGVPLVVPLSALVFLAAFVPTIGAVVSGAVAVLVALVTKGLFPALIVLGVVIAVQQLEGNVLQPLLLGRAVALHPLAVVLSVAAGAVAAGVVGALLAVPLLAVLNAGIRSLRAPDEPPPAAVDPLDPDQATLTPRSRPRLLTRLLRWFTGRSAASR